MATTQRTNAEKFCATKARALYRAKMAEKRLAGRAKARALYFTVDHVVPLRSPRVAP